MQDLLYQQSDPYLSKKHIFRNLVQNGTANKVVSVQENGSSYFSRNLRCQFKLHKIPHAKQANKQEEHQRKQNTWCPVNIVDALVLFLLIDNLRSDVTVMWFVVEFVDLAQVREDLEICFKFSRFSFFVLLGCRRFVGDILRIKSNCNRHQASTSYCRTLPKNKIFCTF